MSSGERLKAARLKAGFKLPQDLAKAIGVSKQAVWDWETNNRIPRTRTLEKLARALGVSVDHLTDGASPERVETAVGQFDIDQELEFHIRRVRELSAEKFPTFKGISLNL